MENYNEKYQNKVFGLVEESPLPSLALAQLGWAGLGLGWAIQYVAKLDKNLDEVNKVMGTSRRITPLRNTFLEAASGSTCYTKPPPMSNVERDDLYENLSPSSSRKLVEDC